VTELLTEKGYQLTKQKLANMKARLAALLARDDLHPLHRAAVEKSYRDMMRQYLRDVKLYEAAHGIKPEADGAAHSPDATPDVTPAPKGT
jgi:hypothetical protein